MAWDQRGGLLAGAGDLRNVRLWDCTAETKLADLPTASESFVTCVDLGLVDIELLLNFYLWNLAGRGASLFLRQVLEMGLSGSLMLGLPLGKQGEI